MNTHRATNAFWRRYGRLPHRIQKLADKNFELLKLNPKHPSLHFKPIGEAWSARIGLGHRAVALQEKNGFAWFWIGNHDDYDRLVG